MRFDNVQNFLPVRMISPVAITSTSDVVSEVLDTKGFLAVTLLFSTGLLNDMVSAVLIEDSDDNVTFAAVADSFLIGNLETNLATVATDDNEVASIGYRGDKRYVRVTVDPTTASGDNLYSLLGLLSDPEKGPTTPPVFTA